MSTEAIFSIANIFAVIGWLALAVKSYWRQSDKFVVGIVVAMLSLLYTYLIATSMRPADLALFGSLDGVSTLFQNKTALLAGWVHYLAFDLMAGLFIVTNARKYNIPHWVAMLCGFGAFMLGPMGLLAYLIIRAIKTKNWFADN